MSTLKSKLFWEKYRPNAINKMILLPRIELILKQGIQTNMIFFGTSGIGKTTVANILSKEHNFIKVNASKQTGIDMLRTTIDNHIGSLNFGAKSDLKVIYLDEFDRASKNLQDGLKGYMEDFENTNVNVRFVFTTNHINRIEPELKSRFTEINFNPLNKNEREFMFKKEVAYIRAVARREGLDYENIEPFNKIITSNFPDLRKSIQDIQMVTITGEFGSIANVAGSDKISFYEFMMEANINPILNYDYVMNNFFTTFEDVFDYLGRPFIEYLKEYHLDVLMDCGGAILDTQRKYNESLENTIDPIIHLITYIIDMKKVLV